jgi:hypothetical protein
MSNPIEPTEAQIDAAHNALIRLQWQLPYSGRAANFTDAEIAEGKLAEQDAEAERENRAEIREILKAALNA